MRSKVKVYLDLDHQRKHLEEMVQSRTEKLEELTDNVNELPMCKKILYLENLNSNDEGYDFKPQYKKYLKDYLILLLI